LLSIFCGLPSHTRLPPFTSTTAGVKRRSPVLAFSWPQDRRDVAVPPCRAYARIVKGRARVVVVSLVLGWWMVDVWSEVWVKARPPVLVHVLVPDERRGGRSPARKEAIWHSVLI
jgi:hypothetical protein